MPIRVLIADDHPVFLEGFCALVKLEYPEIEIVGSAENGDEVVERYHELQPDIVLMDIQMPGTDGVEATRRIRAEDPDARIVVLTTFQDTNLIQAALDAGVKGYMLKEAPVSSVIENTKAVFHGNVLLPAGFWDKIRVDNKRARQSEDSLHAAQAELLVGLTAREKEILGLMLENLSNGMIADRLCIGEHTVRNYVSRIYDSIGVHNRAGLMLWAIENQIM
jgi:DNA-binding NarL/FixJ family response regulator